MEVDNIVLMNKEEAIYVKACVIANGIIDSQGDTLYAEDIKKIFTSFNNASHFEVHHNGIPLKEVNLLENYISTADEAIGTRTVPRGSWLCTIRVDNPSIKEALLDSTFCGVSLSNRIAERCSAGLSGQVTYNDISDLECIIPLFISFVEQGANGFPLCVMDYGMYIKKSKNIGVNKKMSFDLLGSLKNLVKQAEDESEASILKGKDVEVKEEDATIKNEEDITILKEDEQCPNKKEEESEKIEKSEEKPEEEEDEAEIEKAEEASEEETTEEEPAEEESSDDELENKIREIIEKILAEKAEEETAEKEEETAEEETDEPKITKSRKVVIENKTTESQTKNFFEMTGRDPVTGIKIRK